MIRLTDEQWERIRDHFPEEHIADGRPGRKPIASRRVFEAVLWILNTGAQWHMLPQSYPNYKTVHRRFQAWCRDETLRRILTDVANELRDRGVLDEEECFIDATFVMAKGGGAEIGPAKRGKGLKIMAIVDRHGLPLLVSTHAANHHEVRLVQLCFDFYMIEAKPENLIGDRAYDSDPLDEELRRDGIAMIAPHRANRTRPPTQDRRRLSRFRDQIRQIEEARLQRLDHAPGDGPHAMVRLLARVIGVGIETADMLVHEVLSRSLRDRRAVARYAGLTGSPDESGRKRREKGLARSGNGRVRRGMIQLAWRFLLHQKDSALAQWFRARTENARGTRKPMIVALARKLLIALWRLVRQGVVPDGVVLRSAQ